MKGRGFLRIDLGGSWMRASLSEGGRIRRRGRIPAVPWKRLPAALRNLKRRWRLGRIGRLNVGCRGVWKISERRALARSLRWAAHEVRVMSDLELAHEEAFGGGPGILIVAGTGSAAYGLDEKNHSARAGGLGPLLGDEGSAFWMGREALKDPSLAKRLPKGLALRLAHSTDPVRETAKLAPVIFRWARRDRAARSLREKAAEELAALAAELGGRLHFHAIIPVVLHGGLFKDKAFLRCFAERLKEKGLRFTLRSAN